MWFICQLLFSTACLIQLGSSWRESRWRKVGAIWQSPSIGKNTSWHCWLHQEPYSLLGLGSITWLVLTYCQGSLWTFVVPAFKARWWCTGRNAIWLQSDPVLRMLCRQSSGYGVAPRETSKQLKHEQNKKFHLYFVCLWDWHDMNWLLQTICDNLHLILTKRTRNFQ